MDILQTLNLIDMRVDSLKNNLTLAKIDSHAIKAYE